jgi:methyltransferase (TIGR00027 family)
MRTSVVRRAWRSDRRAMIAAQPSRTAVRVALRRAAHQLLDRPVVFVDPIALPMVGRQVAAAMQSHPEKFETQLGARTLRAFLVARSRMAEDALAKAVEGGVRQYVVLGAGLDTFAYRNHTPGLRVFEVDHPATQEWKRTRLKESEIAEPDSLTFVPVDFERQSLRDELVRAGLDPARPTFFSWLGVTMYLTKPAVRATLTAVAELAKGGGGITFDYAVPVESLNFIQRAKYAVLANRVAAAGEPFQSFYDPDALKQQLLATGFTDVRDRGPDALNRKYFAGRTDDLAVDEMGHVLTAWSK